MKIQDNRSSATYAASPIQPAGLGPDSAGQSGDTQGLSNVAEAGPESVAELVAEGQFFEAEAIAGVEDASSHDGDEVHTTQVSEDDVPIEYLGGD